MGGEGKLFPDCCISKPCSIFRICFFRYNLFLDLMNLLKNMLTYKCNLWRGKEKENYEEEVNSKEILRFPKELIKKVTSQAIRKIQTIYSHKWIRFRF